MQRSERAHLVKMTERDQKRGVKLTWLLNFPPFNESANADAGLAGPGMAVRTGNRTAPLKLGGLLSFFLHPETLGLSDSCRPMRQADRVLRSDTTGVIFDLISGAVILLEFPKILNESIRVGHRRL